MPAISTGGEPPAFGTSVTDVTSTLYRSTTAGANWQSVLVIPNDQDGAGGQSPRFSDVEFVYRLLSG